MARKKRPSKVTTPRKALRKPSKALVATHAGSHRRRPAPAGKPLPGLPGAARSRAAIDRLEGREHAARDPRELQGLEDVVRGAEAARKPYPADPADVAAFLQAQAPPIRVTRGGDFEVLKTGVTPNGEPAKRYATLARYLGTLSKLHIDGGHPDPTRDPEVLAVWRVLRRGLDRPAQKAALGFEHIRQALISLPNDLQGKRDRALLLLAYTLMARRSELVALNVEDFEIHADGSATVSFERLKTGERATNYLSPEVMAVVGDWLAAAQIEKGAVFLRLDSARGGARARLTPQSVGCVQANRPDAQPAGPRASPDQQPLRENWRDARSRRGRRIRRRDHAGRRVEDAEDGGDVFTGSQAKRGAMAARLESEFLSITPADSVPPGDDWPPNDPKGEFAKADKRPRAISSVTSCPISVTAHDSHRARYSWGRRQIRAKSSGFSIGSGRRAPAMTISSLRSRPAQTSALDPQAAPATLYKGYAAARSSRAAYRSTGNR